MVTIVISPRDRYSGVLECIRLVYKHTPMPFKLMVLDLGYPNGLRDQIEELLTPYDNARIMNLGLMTPMRAITKIRDRIDSEFTMLLDNDSQVTEGWLPPLLEVVKDDAVAVVNPLTLEKEGVDQGAMLRTHLYTNEIRSIDVSGVEYLIESKSFRRSLPEALPKEIRPSDMFELHGVLFRTSILQSLDIPDMVIREHIDIGLQLHRLGKLILSQPHSVVIFDNLGTRMELSDMRYFFHRWSKKRCWSSAREFERRWGLNFYSEDAMYLWVFRRRIFLICRWLYLPIPVANKITGAAARIYNWFNPINEPLKDPLEHSKRFLP
ncbi:glycosyltransferase family 2 protein [Thalassotalea litorea]|uniref:Glycosyltransferase family 2 protein n=1 Tax=Thalassotalea litorea TaxID=2020715 RepID=A0A5R9IV02_9GAMM|nr:glycosyltransferase [Thalassotalea litorea]TLU65778.1 glycosyltransferase family 2 protein [Thalassotalea litorea]